MGDRFTRGSRPRLDDLLQFVLVYELAVFEFANLGPRVIPCRCCCVRQSHFLRGFLDIASDTGPFGFEISSARPSALSVGQRCP